VIKDFPARFSGRQKRKLYHDVIQGYSHSVIRDGGGLLRFHFQQRRRRPMRDVPLVSVTGTREEFQYCGCCFVGAAGDDFLGDLLHRLQESKGMKRERGHLAHITYG
jgi:hypothetical protein